MSLYKIKIVTFIVLMIPVLIKSQINTQLPDINSCNGNITLPVVVSNCDSISAISLTLQFDTTALNYSGFQQKHPLLQSMLINKVNNKIYLSWASVNFQNIGNDTLVKLKFIFTGDSGNINWDTLTAGNCEYSNLTGNTIPSYYTGSRIYSTFLSPNLISPINLSSEVNNSIYFNWSASNCANSYRYQLSTDTNFYNLIIDTTIIDTNLEINNLLIFNTFYWRIAAKNAFNNYKWSEKRSFYYSNLTTSEHDIDSKDFMPESLIIYPNPCNINSFYIMDSDKYNTKKEVKIYNSNGILIMNFFINNVQFDDIIDVSTSKLTTGLYYISVICHFDSNTIFKSGKLLIEN